MKLRGIDFGNVLGASGVQGFFGEGYLFHHIPGRRPDFSGMALVSKTATLLSNKGNIPLTRNFRPRNPLPGCIKVNFWREAVLNSVRLSNPGLGALLGTGEWQKLTKPFFISAMSLASTPKKRLEELRIMVDMIGFCKDSFSAQFGIQLNLSCQNSGHNPSELIDESAQALDITGTLGVPVMPKYGIDSAPIPAILKLNDHPNCDAICVSNALKFGWQEVNWQRAWGSTKSPLAQLGGGALSGKTLRPLVCEYIYRLRDAGFTKPINGGGGILCSKDVVHYHIVGASSVFLGVVAILHPRRVASIIEQANNLEWRD